MKILMEFPKPKGDDENATAMAEVDRKQVLCTSRGGGGERGERGGMAMLQTDMQPGSSDVIAPPPPAPQNVRSQSCARPATLQQELSADHCYKILAGISDEDCRAMGFNPKVR